MNIWALRLLLMVLNHEDLSPGVGMKCLNEWIKSKKRNSKLLKVWRTKRLVGEKKRRENSGQPHSAAIFYCFLFVLGDHRSNNICGFNKNSSAENKPVVLVTSNAINGWRKELMIRYDFPFSLRFLWIQKLESCLDNLMAFIDRSQFSLEQYQSHPPKVSWSRWLRLHSNNCGETNLVDLVWRKVVKRNLPWNHLLE